MYPESSKVRKSFPSSSARRLEPDSSLGDRVVEYGVMNREMLATDYPGKGYLSDHFPLWVTLEI